MTCSHYILGNPVRMSSLGEDLCQRPLALALGRDESSRGLWKNWGIASQDNRHDEAPAW